jgi:diguanylate cyclase (GGDEF)-like protein
LIPENNSDDSAAESFRAPESLQSQTAKSPESGGSGRHFSWPVAFIGLLILLAVFVLRLIADEASAARTVGITFGSAAQGLVIEALRPGGPAERAGLRVGDRILEIEGRLVATLEVYDEVAIDFQPDQALSFALEREGLRRELEIRPGVTVDRVDQAIAFLMVACFALLALIALSRAATDVRAGLLGAFSALLAFELALPLNAIGWPSLDLLMQTAFLLASGAQMATDIHLCAVIPERHSWLKRRPWLVVLFYIVGFGLGGSAAVATLVEALGGSFPAPFTAEILTSYLLDLGLPFWALAVLGILAWPTFRHPEPQARNQAGLIFLGNLPWALYILVPFGLARLGRAPISGLDAYFPLIILCFPIAVFVAIYRFHLFDLALVVRRSYLYAALSLSLVLFYLIAIGLGSLVFASWLKNSYFSVVFSSAVMFVVGLTFWSLRAFLQRVIDQRFFPERQALRSRLIQLVADLPARGKVAAMAERLVEGVAEVFRVSRVRLLLADPKSDLLLPVADFPGRRPDELGISFLLSPHDDAIKNLRTLGRPAPAAPFLESSGNLRKVLAELDAELLVPLLSHDRLIGILVLGPLSDRRRFPSEELELLSLLAHQAAATFENIRLFESATYEGLTGLLRREAILDVLDRELERARRHARPLVVAIIDLDYFKSINDRFGHLNGDAVLKRVASELAGHLRSSDVIGRFGGEEFLVVLPETDLAGARVVAEKLRQRIETMRFPMPDGALTSLSISIGLGVHHDLAGDPHARTNLLELADQALYLAKGRGRNRVEALEEKPG